MLFTAQSAPLLSFSLSADGHLPSLMRVYVKEILHAFREKNIFSALFFKSQPKSTNTRHRTVAHTHTYGFLFPFPGYIYKYTLDTRSRSHLTCSNGLQLHIQYMLCLLDVVCAHVVVFFSLFSKSSY